MSMYSLRSCAPIRVAAAGLVLGTCCSGALAQTFYDLGSLGGTHTAAFDVSADGLWVVGTSNTEAFRWPIPGPMSGIGMLPGGNSSDAWGVNADASVIVGISYPPSGVPSHAFRWANNTMTDLGVLPGGTNSTAYDVNGNGNVVVGVSGSANGNRAFRWENGTMTDLGVLPGATHSTASGVDAAGLVVVGFCETAGGDRAFRWENGVMTDLGVLPGGMSSVAEGVSYDGLVVVGSSRNASFIDRAVRWDANGVISEIDSNPGNSYALDANLDGSVIVGYGGPAVIWRRGTAGSYTATYVSAEYASIIPAGWGLTMATAVSANGDLIAGRGSVPGRKPSWALAIPVSTEVSVGVNKDFVNNTGQPANDFEWLVEGTYSSVVSHYDGPFPGNPTSVFNTFTIIPVGSNTLFKWENPGAPIAPGGMAHLGITVAGSELATLGATWTLDGVFSGCVRQISLGQGYSHLIGQGVLSFKNTVSDPPNCPSIGLYVGDISVEWLANEVPLADLNGSVDRFPIRTDIIPGTHLISAGTELHLSIPSPAPGAQFAMIKVSIADNPSLIDASTDFMQTIVLMGNPSTIPTMPEWGLIVCSILLLIYGVTVIRRMSIRPLAVTKH